jgi:hypothetical protein
MNTKRALWLVVVRPILIGRAAGWLVGQVLPFLFFGALALSLTSICLTSAIYYWLGWDKVFTVKDGHIEWVAHRSAPPKP